MEIDGRAFEVEAAVSNTLPVSVLLGGDVPELKLLIAFFYSNIKSVLQSNSQLQAVKARDAIHGFVCIPMIKVTCILIIRL